MLTSFAPFLFLTSYGDQICVVVAIYLPKQRQGQCVHSANSFSNSFIPNKKNDNYNTKNTLTKRI